MKCPKCGYHSFDHLDICKKCGHNLAGHKAKFNLRGFIAPGHVAMAAVAPAPLLGESFEEEEEPDDGSVDFGFDFLDEKEDKSEKVTKNNFFDDDSQAVNINQPFGADCETVPADDPDCISDDKPGKGSKFAF
jgi:hypothetical protein